MRTKCATCRYLKDHWECTKYGEDYSVVREWHNYWECPNYEEHCQDMLWDYKENHDWRHVIGVRDLNPDQSCELYICNRCGAILLRKWGKEIIINDKSSDVLGNNVVSHVIAGGLNFDERNLLWEESE